MRRIQYAKVVDAPHLDPDWFLYKNIYCITFWLDPLSQLLFK